MQISVIFYCQELSNIPGWKAKEKLNAIPPGLPFDISTEVPKLFFCV